MVWVPLSSSESVGATLTQKLQFDTDDHSEDYLPLRSRVLSPPFSFMRMERGHSESHAPGSNSAQRHAHVPSLLAVNHTTISRSLLPASQILWSAQRALPLLANQYLDLL